MAEEPRQKQCKMIGCENSLSIHSKFEFCANCRNRIEFWAKRSPTEFLARKATLAVWSNRLDFVREERRDKYMPRRARRVTTRTISKSASQAAAST